MQERELKITVSGRDLVWTLEGHGRSGRRAQDGWVGFTKMLLSPAPTQGSVQPTLSAQSRNREKVAPTKASVTCDLLNQQG